MTAPTTNYPALELRAPVANPIAVGTLYRAATIEEMASPARIDGGARIEQTNGGEAYGTWPLDCPTPGDTQDKRGERGAALSFPAFAVWAVDECSLVGVSDREAIELATQQLRLREELAVSEAFAETLLDRAGSAASAAGGMIGALSAIEDELGRTGVRGVVHASRRHIAAAAHFGLIVRGNSGRLETPGGHDWAFGTGYGALGDTLVGTGPVTIYRTQVLTTPTIEHRQNERTVLAEREVLPTFQLTAVAHEIGA